MHISLCSQNFGKVYCKIFSVSCCKRLEKFVLEARPFESGLLLLIAKGHSY